MNNAGINQEKIKESNRLTILRLLNNMGPMSRKDIAETVGLTPASVTKICADLIEEKVIEELGEAEETKHAGRKKILVALNTSFKYVLCAGIETEETYLSITDLKGEVLYNTVMLTDNSIPPEKFLKKIANQIKTLMWEAELSKDQVLGVGVSIPGRVDSDQGISINTYSIWYEPVEVKRILESELGVTVLLENNVKAFAQSELLFGSGRRVENLLVLKWGPGVGSSIIVNNSVYQGATGLSAEIGHMIRHADGIQCKCGRKGCLQTEISTHAMIDSVLKSYGETEEEHQKMPVLHQWILEGNTISFKNAGTWASLEDEVLQKILSKKIEDFVYAAINMVAVLDPSRIVVFGYLFDIPSFFERFKKTYLNLDISRSEDFIVKADISQNQNHTEALAVVVGSMLLS